MQDIVGVVFVKHYELLEVTIENKDFEEIERFWQKSLTMASRGQELRTLVESSCTSLGFFLVDKFHIPYLCFISRKRQLENQSFCYAEVRTLWHARNIIASLRKGQYSTVYSYAIRNEQEITFLKIPAVVLGDLQNESLGTYLYFYLKCCLLSKEDFASKINTILNIQNMTCRSLTTGTLHNLGENINNNNDEEVRSLLLRVLEEKWKKML